MLLLYRCLRRHALSAQRRQLASAADQRKPALVAMYLGEPGTATHRMRDRFAAPGRSRPWAQPSPNLQATTMSDQGAFDHVNHIACSAPHRRLRDPKYGKMRKASDATGRRPRSRPGRAATLADPAAEVICRAASPPTSRKRRIAKLTIRCTRTAAALHSRCGARCLLPNSGQNSDLSTTKADPPGGFRQRSGRVRHKRARDLGLEARS